MKGHCTATIAIGSYFAVISTRNVGTILTSEIDKYGGIFLWLPMDNNGRNCVLFLFDDSSVLID